MYPINFYVWKFWKQSRMKTKTKQTPYQCCEIHTYPATYLALVCNTLYVTLLQPWTIYIMLLVGKSLRVSRNIVKLFLLPALMVILTKLPLHCSIRSAAPWFGVNLASRRVLTRVLTLHQKRDQGHKPKRKEKKSLLTFWLKRASVDLRPFWGRREPQWWGHVHIGGRRHYSITKE